MVIQEKDFADQQSRQIFLMLKQAYERKDDSLRLRLICELHSAIVKRICDETVSLSEIQNRGKKSVIFGVGKQGSQLCEALRTVSMGGQLVGFCDNNVPLDTTEEHMNLPVHRPKYYAGDPGVAYLIPTGIFSRGMMAQLVRLGVPDDHILPVSMSYLTSDDKLYDVNLEAIFFNPSNKFLVFGGEIPECNLLGLLRRSKLDCDIARDETELKQRLCEEDRGSRFVICMDITTELQALHSGVDKSGIIRMIRTMDEYQYFDDEIIPLSGSSQSRVFIDGGSCDLSTSRSFLDWCNGACDRIYAFECDSKGIGLCKNKLQSGGMQQFVTLIPKGLWSREDVLYFREDQSVSASHVTEQTDSTTSVAVTSIDDILQGKQVTFIKMDIEGAELEALYGAKESILSWHPTLAISVYHKPEDIVEIPAFIHGLCPQYKLYLRCYHEEGTETVLYALWRDSQGTGSDSGE